MPQPFGIRHPITYEQLLRNLEQRCACRVTRTEGVRDTDGSEPEATYLVERWTKSRTPQPRFYIIEVYHHRLVVLPDVLASICEVLELSEEDAGYVPPH